MSAQPRPLVTALINTYNYARYLPFAIDSVLAQTYPNIEIVVVDDGSVDHTAEVLAHYGDRLRVIVTENGGQGQAFNVGIAAAKGELIMLLDADDVWLPRKVERMVALAEEHPEAGMLYHRYLNVDLYGNDADQAHPEWMISGDYRAGFLRSGGQYWHPITSVLTLRADHARSMLPLPTYAVREGADSIISDCSMLLTRIAASEQVLARRLMHGANLYATGREEFERADDVRRADVRRIEWRSFYVRKIVKRLGHSVEIDISRNEWVMANLYALGLAPVWKVARAFLLNPQKTIRVNLQRFWAFRQWKLSKSR